MKIFELFLGVVKFRYLIFGVKIYFAPLGNYDSLYGSQKSGPNPWKLNINVRSAP